MSNLPRNFVVLDLETTAFIEEDGAICEIAMLEVEDLRIVDRLHYILDPQRPLTPGAAKANGFRDTDFIGRPKFRDVVEEIDAWLRLGKIVIGYNIERFDRKMLALEFSRLGLDMPTFQSLDMWPVLKKTVTQDQLYEKTGTTSYKQTNIAQYFGISIDGAHRASADCEVLLQITAKVLELTPESITATNLVIDKDGKIDKAINDIAPDKIATEAVRIITEFLSKHFDRLSKSKNIVVDSADTVDKAANEIAWLKTIKNMVVDERKKALEPIKKLTSIIEAAFRDYATRPIDDAMNFLLEARSDFLRKKYEDEATAAEVKRIELVEEAEKQALAAFEAAPAPHAVDVSNAVYTEGMARAASISVDTRRNVNTGLSKAKDSIVFDVEIVDAKAIPNRFMCPDIEAIKKFANATEGKIPLPGVSIFVATVKSSIRR